MPFSLVFTSASVASATTVLFGSSWPIITLVLELEYTLVKVSVYEWGGVLNYLTADCLLPRRCSICFMYNHNITNNMSALMKGPVTNLNIKRTK
jgi:hypothetical protein